MLKAATHETTALYSIIRTWIGLEICYNNDQQFNRHDFL